jgi:hypothetical protein
MTEVEAILFIATYLCVALAISCKGQQRGHWFYYHDHHCCIATLDLVAIDSTCYDKMLWQQVLLFAT